MDYAGYEDRFGPIRRRLFRAARVVRRLGKGALGLGRTVLVETRWRLGDEVMALPIYEALRERRPRDRIVAFCNYPDLLEGNPFVDAVNDVRRDPDQYFLLRGAPRDICRIEHYARCARVGTPAVRPKLYYRDWSTAALDGLAPGGPIIAVSAGASWPTKRWDIDRWRTLCRGLIEAGYRVVELGRGCERIGEGLSLVDETSVRDAACALHAARLFVACDSGLMHLALAAGTPTLALFGPTAPSILFRNEPDLVALTNERDCQGCWNRSAESAEPGDCPRGVAHCLETVSQASVLTRIQELVALES